MNTTKTVLVAVFAAFAASAASAGWTTDAMIEEAARMAAQCRECMTLPEPAMFYGWRSGDVWNCCEVDTSDGGLSFHMVGEPTMTPCNTIQQVLTFGKFDDAKSLDKFLKQFDEEVWDPMEEMMVNYSLYDVIPLAAVYYEVYEDNKEILLWALECMRSAQTKKINEVAATVNGGGGGGGSGGGSESDPAKTVEQIKKTNDAMSEGVKEQVDDLNKQAESAASELTRKEIELGGYDYERTEAARAEIENALNELDNAISLANEAVEAGDDFDKLKEANASIIKMINALDRAKTSIDGLGGAEYGPVVEEINNTIIEMDAVRILFEEAKNERNMAKASTALDRARAVKNGGRLARKMRHASISVYRHMGAAARAQMKYDVLLHLIAAYTDLYTEVTKMRDEVDHLIARYMTDMNTLGAYLGSTNAMAYFSAPVADRTTEDGFKRWFKFSVPEELDGHAAYYDRFNSYWYTVFHNLQSQLFIQAIETDDIPKLMRQFGMGSFQIDNFRGFQDTHDFDDHGHVVTNWIANKITAPKNWADGETVVVTNGKFSVKSANKIKVLTDVTWSGGELIKHFTTIRAIEDLSDDSDPNTPPKGEKVIFTGVNDSHHQ